MKFFIIFIFCIGMSFSVYGQSQLDSKADPALTNQRSEVETEATNPIEPGLQDCCNHPTNELALRGINTTVNPSQANGSAPRGNSEKTQ